MSATVISTLLWAVLLCCLGYFAVVQVALRMHGPGKNNIFGTTARKENRTWRARLSLVIACVVLYFGWRYLLHPIFPV
jgi:amino acid permease